MGILVEFNPDLTLRNINHFKQGKRLMEECIPERLELGKSYGFLKEGQRNYWLLGEQPLLQTEGNQQLSSPVASIVILEATHFIKEGKIFTKGKYLVKEIFTDQRIRFNGFKKVELN